MKKLLFLSIICVLGLASCNSDKPKSEKTGFEIDGNTSRGEAKLSEQEKTAMALNTIISSELSSGKSVNKLIPGYEFGMNAKELERMNKKLARRGDVEKIRKAQKREFAYAYQMPILGGDANTFFNFSFNDKGEVYKGEGLIIIPEGSSSSDVMNLTYDLFRGWFGQPKFDLPRFNYCSRYVWIDGNRLVELRCEVEGVVCAFYNLKEEVPNLFQQQAPQPEEKKTENNTSM